MNPNRTGLALGLFSGFVHLLWALLVLFGLAQPLIDFIYGLHMIIPVDVVGDFSLSKAVSLVGTTLVVGYLVGYIFAWFWNKLNR